MCRPWLWFWGVLPLALIALLALYFKPDPIQSDLAARARAELAENGFGWAEASADGRDLTIVGTAPSQEARESARQVASSVWGVRTVVDNSSLLALADPFVWSASRQAGGAVRLVGFAPSREDVETLVQKAKNLMPGTRVDATRLALARGAPEIGAWRAATALALEHLAGMESGQVSLDGLSYSLAGGARTPDDYESIHDGLRALPREYRLPRAP